MSPGMKGVWLAVLVAVLQCVVSTKPSVERVLDASSDGASALAALHEESHALSHALASQLDPMRGDVTMRFMMKKGKRKEPVEDYPNFFNADTGMPMPADYNREERPGGPGAPPDAVEVGIDIVQVYSIDEASGVASCDVLVHERWVDKRLANVTYSGSVEEGEAGYPVWIPGLRVRNSVSQEDVVHNVVVEKGGHVTLVERWKVDVVMNLELWCYPYDVQVLRILVSAFSWGAHEVKLKGYDPPGEFKMRGNSGWVAESWKVGSLTKESMFAEGAEDSFAVGSLLVSRQYFGPTLTEILPLFIVVIFAHTALFVSHQGNFDTQLAVGSFGLLTVMEVTNTITGDKLPRVSYLLWMHLLLVLCFGVCLWITVHVVMLHYMQVTTAEEEEEIERLDTNDDGVIDQQEIKTGLLETGCATCKQNEGMVAKHERRIRLLTPLIFIGLLLTLMILNFMTRYSHHNILEHFALVPAAPVDVTKKAVTKLLF